MTGQIWGSYDELGGNFYTRELSRQLHQLLPALYYS